MLGAIGFISAFVAIILFVVSFHYAFPRLPRNVSYPFTIAFMMLAGVMALAAVAVLIDKPDILESTIITIDVVLLIATGFLLSVLLPIKHPIIITLLAVLAGLALATRVFNAPLTAVINDGILYFNLEGGVRMAVMAGLYGIWLPASYVVARRSIEITNLREFHEIIVLAYMMLVVSAGVFFAARTEGMIIASFGALVVAFISIAGFNVVLKRIADSQVLLKGRSHAKRAK